jgi:hypothetical protein
MAMARRHQEPNPLLLTDVVMPWDERSGDGGKNSASSKK